MNKEECLKALNNLSRYANIGRAKHGAGGCVVDNFVGNNESVIYNLICDHFDNLPLKFEELEVGMWVWDNELRMYFLIKGKFNITVGSYKVLEIITSNLSNGTWHYNTCHIYYQENRFYRKEVK